MILTSSEFSNAQEIPKKYGYNFENINPPLEIEQVPENTKSLVLLMDDPDALAAVGKVWVHWIIWNISPETKFVPENFICNYEVEGKNDFGEIGYGGPAPPDREHTYVFKLLALNEKIDLKKGSEIHDLENAIKSKIISETKLLGRYSP
ncbi:MAG: YbhB/YbcL family Raf kinase inhibitor-like protein [Nitrosopumilus sp.]